MQLGVFDGYMPVRCDALSSASKIGGEPVYTFSLSPEDEKVINDAKTCGVCAKPMFLLLQLYAPPFDGNESISRMKYVFACNNSECSAQPSKSWCSLTLSWNGTDEEALDADDADDDNAPLSHPEPSARLHAFSFPPSFIDVKPEPELKSVIVSPAERPAIANSEHRQEESQAPATQQAHAENTGAASADMLSQEEAEELEKAVDLKNNAIDNAFSKFISRIEQCPSQVFRYLFAGQPLFMNSKKLSDCRIPPCSRCGKQMVMELQLMPTIIHFLHADDYTTTAPTELKHDGFDFSTATVYVCEDPACSSIAKNLFRKGEKSELNITKDFILVESPPTIEEEQAERTSHTSSLREILLGKTA